MTKAGKKCVSSYTHAFLRHFSATAKFFSQLKEMLWRVFISEADTSGRLEFDVEASQPSVGHSSPSQRLKSGPSRLKPKCREEASFVAIQLKISA
jgi:hypothetical protein